MVVRKIEEPTREQKIKDMIYACLNEGIEIPEQWINEYNNQVIQQGIKDAKDILDNAGITADAYKQMANQLKRLNDRIDIWVSNNKLK